VSVDGCGDVMATTASLLEEHVQNLLYIMCSSDRECPCEEETQIMSTVV
jgi:hypothetical protein